MAKFKLSKRGVTLKSLFSLTTLDPIKKKKYTKVYCDINNYIKVILKPRGRAAFLENLEENASLLDVGCGSRFLKIATNKQIGYYLGLDIVNRSSGNMPGNIQVIHGNPEDFSELILNIDYKFDAIISCHNIEHCNQPINTLKAMITRLKKGGFLYLAFPSEKSLYFPSRRGCLNYFDDPTHKDCPPDFTKIIDTCVNSELEVIFQSLCYKPLSMRIIGAILEPLSKLLNKCLFGTWELYGFESILIFRAKE